MEQFFNMGGYAAFVWPAYGLSAIALAGLAAFIWRRGRRLRQRLRQLDQVRGGAQQNAAGVATLTEKTEPAD
ncbi:MAG: heme exporter protein CcmD [Alphaproteobacteria bacterium]|nr:heme exporter protein CcmD [Alphaproteobacteria bacterium]